MVNSNFISILVFEYERIKTAISTTEDMDLYDFLDTSLANIEGALREVCPGHHVDQLLGIGHICYAKGA